MPNEGRNYNDLIEVMTWDKPESMLPNIYTKWASISAIAGAMGRRCWFSIKNPRGDGENFRIFPSMYVILVGSPGSGKSASMALPIDKVYCSLMEDQNMPRDKWEGKWTSYGMPYPLFIDSSRITAEKLAIVHSKTRRQILELTTLDENTEPFTECAMTLTTSEFGSLMERYDKPMQLYLTEAWDAKERGYTYKTKNDVDIKVPCITLNWLACSTPEELITYLPESVKAQGFLSRVILVVYNGLDIDKDLEYDCPSDREVEYMVEDLASVGSMMGEFSFENDEVYQEVRQWLKKTKGPNAVNLREYCTRRMVHIMRLAMVVSAARRSTRIITRDDFYRAVELLEEAELKMPLAVAKIGMSPVGKVAKELADVIYDKGKVTTFEFTNMMLGKVRTPAECRTLFEAMKDAKMIDVLGSTIKPGETTIKDRS